MNRVEKDKCILSCMAELEAQKKLIQEIIEENRQLRLKIAAFFSQQNSKGPTVVEGPQKKIEKVRISKTRCPITLFTLDRHQILLEAGYREDIAKKGLSLALKREKENQEDKDICRPQ